MSRNKPAAPATQRRSTHEDARARREEDAARPAHPTPPPQPQPHAEEAWRVYCRQLRQPSAPSAEPLLSRDATGRVVGLDSGGLLAAAGVDGLAGRLTRITARAAALGRRDPSARAEAEALIRAARRLASAPQARPADLDELEAALARRAARSMAATLSDTPQETATQQLEIIPQTPKTPVLGRRRTGLTALQIAPPMLASLTTLLGAGLSCHLPALGGGLLLGGLILGFIFWWRAS